ncbi:MAG: phosphoribosyltransferase family protein [Phycisphaerae bacterium]
MPVTLSSLMTSTLRATSAVLRDMVDTIVPDLCAACGRPQTVGRVPLCAACDATRRAQSLLPMCPRCARVVRPEAIHGERCYRCRREPAWNIAGIACVGPYEQPLAPVLLGLKFSGHERNADALADWLAQAIEQRPWCGEIDVLVPVPMHWLRRLQRPCRHADVLCRALARRMRIPMSRAVVRTRYSPSQMQIPSRNDRFENVQDCFGPRRWPAPRVGGLTVCIVDNLLMTGATVHEVSKVLRKAGAKRIYAAVAARSRVPNDGQAMTEALLGQLSAEPRERATPNVRPDSSSSME